MSTSGVYNVMPDGRVVDFFGKTLFNLNGYQQQPTAPAIQQQTLNNAPSTPFTSASSGGVSGTLQPYVNRMTQNANNALYGGLLNYQPQSIVSGNAGGTPVNSTPPQGFSLQGGLLGGANFGKRSWMAK